MVETGALLCRECGERPPLKRFLIGSIHGHFLIPCELSTSQIVELVEKVELVETVRGGVR